MKKEINKHDWNRIADKYNFAPALDRDRRRNIFSERKSAGIDYMAFDISASSNSDYLHTDK